MSDIKVLQKRVVDAKRQYEDMRGTIYWNAAYYLWSKAEEDLRKAKEERKRKKK